MVDQKMIKCVKVCAEYYATLAEQKQDCDEQVAASIDLLVSESNEQITSEMKGQIKKLAKYLSAEKLDKLSEETDALANLIDALKGE